MHIYVFANNVCISIRSRKLGCQVNARGAIINATREKREKICPFDCVIRSWIVRYFTNWTCGMVAIEAEGLLISYVYNAKRMPTNLKGGLRSQVNIHKNLIMGFIFARPNGGQTFCFPRDWGRKSSGFFSLQRDN